MDEPRPAAWLAALRERLPRHADVLARLAGGARSDARVVQLLVGCSVGRGVADELSDLDCHLSLEDAQWPGALELVETLVRSAGEVVELLHHRWPGAGGADHRRTAVQYRNGVQLDLMVSPVTAWSGMHPPDAVVLYESRPVFTRPWDPATARAGPDRVAEWLFLGWWALLDARKYVLRGSLWEARQRLEEARALVWQLAAASQGLPFPEYGITALLDSDRPQLPAGTESTVAGLDGEELMAAVRRCAVVLEAQWRPALLATGGGDAAAPEPEYGRWARERLLEPILPISNRPRRR